ncbi:hypothetical protein ABPG77_010453 [Micractinium sp. CCAP 211/92]
MRGACALLLLPLLLTNRAQLASADLLTAITANEQLSELRKYASQYRDLLTTLANLKTGTVLAPKNAAFAKLLKAATAAGVELDKATVETVLKYHVIPEGAYLKADLSDGQKLDTAAGVPLTATYTDGNLGWKGVGSSAMDVQEMKVGNVAMHVIDNVLLPVELSGPTPASPSLDSQGATYPDVVAFATSNNLTQLMMVFQATGLLDTVVDFKGTLFAPTNDAFDATFKLLVIGATTELNDSVKAAIAAMMKYHLVADKVTTLEDGYELTTIEGEPLQVVVKNGKAYIKDSTGAEAEVVEADITAGDTELTIIKPVGCGSFGSVYLASWHQTQVAAKILIDREALLGRADSKEGSMASSLILPPSLASKLDEEASLMASLRHPNIVGFLGVCSLPPCMISEYCARGSLASVLAAGRQDASVAAELTWRRRLSMALDGALGMLYLHSRPVPICHRDLKSPNLLVDEHMRVKVADFNLSRLVQESSRTSSAAVMNPRWLAPEVLHGARATLASDVFAFGLVMWELLTWELPWTGAEAENPWQIVGMVVAGARPAVPQREQLPGPDVPPAASLEAYLQLMR